MRMMLSILLSISVIASHAESQIASVNAFSPDEDLSVANLKILPRKNPFSKIMLEAGTGMNVTFNPIILRPNRNLNLWILQAIPLIKRRLEALFPILLPRS